MSVFLNQAEAAGARHITYLGAYGIDSAPPGAEAFVDAEAAKIISHVSGQAINYTAVDEAR